MNAPASNSARKQRLLTLLALVVLAIVGYFAYYFLHGRYFEETDDAYVSSDLIQITSEISGTVASVLVDDTQHVDQGQLLVQLDKADAEIALAAAEAELARAVRTVRGVFAKSNALQASIRANNIALQTATADLQRRQQVAQQGGVSAEELQHARDQVSRLEAALTSSREELDANNAQIDNTSVENHPQVLAAAAKVREAALALKRTQITAPSAGVIARRSVQIGSRIGAGSPLMAVVPLDNAWVDANFKEVQLAQMRVGQPVEVVSDFYGDSQVFHGKIAGMGAGSGAAFALLPPQNASGNWIKIVQRLPVRISLDPAELAAHPLRVGLSMRVTVDMHDQSGSLVATQVRSKPQTLVKSEDHDQQVDAKIASIIRANAGAN